jgi:hypothetical protein
VNHKHFSTRFLRNMTRIKVWEYFCTSCKKAHGSYPTPRVKLCLSGSTLHMFFALPAKGDALRTEYITIPGAKVEALQQAFRFEYGKETRDIDVFVVAGLNKILKEDSPKVLMRKFDLFRNINKKGISYQSSSKIKKIYPTYLMTSCVYKNTQTNFLLVPSKCINLNNYAKYVTELVIFFVYFYGRMSDWVSPLFSTERPRNKEPHWRQRIYS